MKQLIQKYNELNQKLIQVYSELKNHVQFSGSSNHATDPEFGIEVCEEAIKWANGGGEVEQQDIDICEAELKDMRQLLAKFKKR